MEIWIWTAVIVLSLVIEFATMDLVSIWFSGGALVALILAGCGVAVLWQIIAFLVVSTALLFGIRKLTKKFLDRGTIKTNSDSMVGKKYKLINPITETEHGTIKIGDVLWACISEDNSSIAEGKVVTVTEIQGNKLVVKEEK